MSAFSITGVTLPKWPAMVVVGKTVSTEQAKEIIIRTSGLSFHSNEHSFVKRLYDVAGIKCDKHGWADYDSRDARCDELGIIRGEYLRNDQVCSSYINGPHGWIDWRGNIGCRTFNIGKWPKADEVFGEWSAIAEAFRSPHCCWRAGCRTGSAG